MYKLVIADDEVIVFQFVKMVIEKNRLPLEICGTAENGTEAIRLIDQYKPEFVMLDINMPGYNGLEVAEQMRAKYPDMFIYIVTAYKEFDYVYKAMHVAVTDYLVKPIKPDDLVEALKKGISLAAKRNQDRDQAEAVKKQLAAQYPIVMKERITELLRMNESDATLLPLLRQFSGRQHFMPIAVCALAGWLPPTKAGDLEKLPVREEDFSLFHDYGVLLSKEDTLVLILDHWNASVRAQLQQTVATCEQQRGGVFSTVIYMKQDKPLAEIYKKAIETCHMNLFWQVRGTIILGTSAKEETEREEKIDFTHTYAVFEQFLINHETAAGKEYMARIFAEMQAQEYPRSLVNVSLIKFGCDLLDQYGKALFPAEKVRHMEEAYIAAINGASHAGAVQRYVYQLIDDLTQNSAASQNSAEKIVKWAQNYMEDNYYQDITLEQVAKVFYVSEGYMCRIFKKYTGKRYIAYLTDIRMKKAKELLVSGKFTIAEVARKTGFKDASYFSTVFKKYYAYPPSKLLVQSGDEHSGK